MPRIRTIKPDFWTSEQIVECSTNARLLFVGLWNFCDDGGVHPASCLRLKMEVYPGDDFTESQIGAMVGELVDADLVVVFNAEGKEYWQVTGWRHQKIDRPSLRFPQRPPDDHSTNDRRTIVDGHPPEKEKEKEKEKEVRGAKSRNGIIATGSGESAQGDTCGPPAKPKRGRRPAVTVEDATFPPGLDTPAGRVALERWLTHKRAIRKGYRSVSAVDQLLKQWADKTPADFAAAVDHSIGNEYQGLFAEGNNGRKPTTPRFGPGQKYDPNAGVGDPSFGKL